jgi:hypothetical protein
MKKLDVFVIVLLVLGLVSFFALATVNLDLFMWSAGTANVIGLTAIFSNKFKKWLDMPLFNEDNKPSTF